MATANCRPLATHSNFHFETFFVSKIGRGGGTNCWKIFKLQTELAFVPFLARLNWRHLPGRTTDGCKRIMTSIRPVGRTTKAFSFSLILVASFIFCY